jgi:hypothetical protein
MVDMGLAAFVQSVKTGEVFLATTRMFPGQTGDAGARHSGTY